MNPESLYVEYVLVRECNSLQDNDEKES